MNALRKYSIILRPIVKTLLMNKFFILITICCLSILSCNERVSEDISAQSIIDKSIAVSGGQKLDSSSITFNFRDRHYVAKRNHGDFLYARITTSLGDSIFDLLTNEGFERFINDELVAVPDSMAVKYTSSVNSVHYFSVLPYGLNDAAVIKTYLGQVKIKDNDYHKIQVTFKKEGGGEDFEDVFVYWIHTETHKVNYLAYSYNEDDGIGLRFREAYNERFVNTVRFVDYNNFKPIDASVSVQDLDRLFREQKLELLSKIELKNISVN